MSDDDSQLHVLGPGQITLDGLDMGFVSKVAIDLTAEQVQLVTSAYGKAPLGVIRLGEEGKITCTFDQVNTVNYAKAISGATRNVSGSDSNVSVGSFGGTRLTPMLFVYVPRDPTLSAFSLTAWKVVPGPGSKIMLDETQQNLPVEFIPLIDTSKANGMKLLAFGDITVVTDAVAPTAVLVPADDATVAAAAIVITATFNKAMDPATLNTDNIYVVDNAEGIQAPVAASISVNAALTVATLTPNSTLTVGHTFSLVVGTGCKSASGIRFGGAVENFTTS